MKTILGLTVLVSALYLITSSYAPVEGLQKANHTNTKPPVQTWSA